MDKMGWTNIWIALYKGSENLNSSYVKTTQDVLQRVADVASDLREYFPVPEPESLNGISRVSGYLNLLYHQVCHTSPSRDRSFTNIISV